MITWKKEYELGITGIDRQHQELISIVDQLSVLIENQETSDEATLVVEYGNILQSLRSYTKYHFRAEEDLFLKHNYPGTVAHIKEHREFIDFLDEVYDKNDGYDIQQVRDLYRRVVQWIFHHIVATDFLYKDYLLSKIK